MEDEEGCINVVVFKTVLPYNEYFHPNIPNTFFSNSLIWGRINLTPFLRHDCNATFTRNKELNDVAHALLKYALPF